MKRPGQGKPSCPPSAYRYHRKTSPKRTTMKNSQTDLSAQALLVQGLRRENLRLVTHTENLKNTYVHRKEIQTP